MRALVITNMYPSGADPARGSFVRDQVEALRRLPDLDVELFAFERGGARPYLEAARQLRRRYRGVPFDIVHTHFGLGIWPSLAIGGAPHAATLHGTDLVHPRSRAITLAGIPFLELVAPVSQELAARIPALLARGRVEVLPMGVSTERFQPIERREARRALGLDADRRYLLFPADPARPEKRYDRALRVAAELPLLTLGAVAPEQVPLWVNAADAVLVTSERESFGLAVLEALACDVPVLATPVGIAPEALRQIDGTLCAPFDPAVWRRALDLILGEPDPRVRGRAAAERFSATHMAARLAGAWRSLSGRS